jgi:aspartyl-tRNA(Asn)/glutamyl-tRNA(Gln) amidotransferase subunit C
MPVIEREQVLHVARLSRLKLSEDEVSAMQGDMSSILDHVDRLSEIEIEGVEPTSHVVPLENVLRDDVPRPSLDRETSLSQAPDPSDGAFRVPSPQAEA